MHHYFINEPDSELKPYLIPFDFLGKHYEIYADKHLFSCQAVDRGSLILTEVACQLPVSGDVLDLGCGYGLVGLLVAAHCRCNVEMLDINARAVALAHVNIKAWNLSKLVQAYVSDGFTNVKKKYDYILFNPPIRAGKAVYYPLFEAAKHYLNPGGSLLIVIRKRLGADSAFEFLSKHYSAKRIHRTAGYHIISCQIKEGSNLWVS